MVTNAVDDSLMVEAPQPTVYDAWEEGRYPYLVKHAVGTLMLTAAALVALWFCLATFAPSGTAVHTPSHRGVSHHR